jgi:hypothetical protein
MRGKSAPEYRRSPISPKKSTLESSRGRDVLALQGQVFWEASAFLLSFWA